MSKRRGRVRLDGRACGWIEETEEGTAFQYDETYLASAHAVPISLTMPLRVESYAQRGLHPFFENLLPEGWLLEISTAKLKVQRDDVFGLLLATCRDCIGAVEIVSAETEE